jgi:hypothetical protein
VIGLLTAVPIGFGMVGLAGRFGIAMALFFSACIGTGWAEIIKTVTIDCDGRMCFHWWPRLPPLPGWHTDDSINQKLVMNVLIPNRFTWSSANTIMYARALYKPHYPSLTSLSAFIADDRRSFAENNREIVIAEASPLTTKDGQILRSLTYFRPRDHNWERVSYGEEGDYYLVFVINAHSEAGFRNGQVVYEELIHAYIH